MAALGPAAFSSAQAQYASPDLLLGFTGGSSSDILFDIGSPQQIGIGSAPGTVTDLSSSISLSLLNNNGYSSLAGKSFGAIGYTSGVNAGIYSTVAPGYAPNQVGNRSAYNGISLTIDDTGSYIDGTGSPANSAVASRSDPNSWNMNVATPGANTFYDNYGNGLTDIPLTGGTDVANLYFAKDDNSKPQLAGWFTMNPGEQLSFTVVPEPGTNALLAASGLVVFAFRRCFNRKA